MNPDRFRELIQRSESETLDFKREAYDIGTPRGRGRLSFIKDLLAMANTPREGAAHIVLGVAWTPESGCEVCGLVRQIDDAEFQRAVGDDHVQPNPRFTYVPLEFEQKQVGVIEIPMPPLSHGPYTPTKDRSKKGSSLRSGALYFRRGSENSTARSADIRRIVAWFDGRQENEAVLQIENIWRSFLDSIYNFESSRKYILVSDCIPANTNAPIHALGTPLWRCAIDFDPKSDISGLLSRIQGSLGRHSVVHKVVSGDYRVQPEPGVHWLFARGLSGLSESTVDDSYRKWLVGYKAELTKQLQAVSYNIGHSPVVALVVWSSRHLKQHLQCVLDELLAAFGEQIDIVVVSPDNTSFSEIVEERGATFINMNLRNLCNGLLVKYGDLGDMSGESYTLPMLSGAPFELERDDRLWLSEDLELVHLMIGMDGNNDPKQYRLGGDISWRDLNLHHDCDRDITVAVRRQVEDDLGRRQTTRINIYHEPGAGGTTVGHRVAWELHEKFPVTVLRHCTPSETAERISKIAALTENSVLVIIDGGRHSERDIDDLYEYLRANQTPTVLVQILRRFRSQGSGGSQAGKKRQFRLSTTLSRMEADRFCSAYQSVITGQRRRQALAALAKNEIHCNAFFFGLTAFERDFRGLADHVKVRMVELTEKQRQIMMYISIAHYYGQQSIPKQAFLSFLGIPKTSVVDISAIFTAKASPALALLTQNEDGELRTTHQFVAEEILRQILGPIDGVRANAVWKQKLSSAGGDFADFCRGDEMLPSRIGLELARRVFIYRDNAEILGTEQVARSQFAQFVEDIPSKYGRKVVLNYLTNVFPSEAHFHAHKGRLLSLSDEYDEALRCVDTAIELQPDDHVLHHMKGMVLRRKIKLSSNTRAARQAIVDIAKEASASFAKSRELRPDRDYGYVSEVQMLIDLIDKVGKRNASVIGEVLAQPNVDPFLQGSLDRAEELLDSVQRLQGEERPSQYITTCRARLANIYGDYTQALQAWDNLLSRKDVVKTVVRRQIVWTMLRRSGGQWDRMKRHEKDRARLLLENNLDEEMGDSGSLRLWLRAIRHVENAPQLEMIIEKVGYWKVNTGVLDAAFYLYVIHTLNALRGSLQSAADARNALEECRALAQYRADRARSFEWVGRGEGIRALVHQSRLGNWGEDFWESPDLLVRREGRIKSIGGPQRGRIELREGIDAFFVPGKAGLHVGKDENARVDFYLGFSYDGPRAWDVKRVDI